MAASFVTGALGLTNHLTGRDGRRANFWGQIAAAELGPPNPGRETQVGMLKLFEKSLTPLVLAIVVPGMVLDVLPFAGGFLTTPAGIYALVALMDPDVKAAFAARKESRP